MKTSLKKIKPEVIAVIVILAAGLVIALAFGIRAAVVYFSGHEITITDQTSNINVILTRTDNWEKIQTGKISLTPEDFSFIDGSTATIPITAELARQFCDASDENIGDFIDHNTTHDAYINLICTYGDPDNFDTYVKQKMYERLRIYTEKRLIFATEPSDEELSAAEKEGVTLDVTPVALDGFVFITHKDNPIDSLTVEQIQDIYSGKITNWKEVGGSNSEIIPYQREKNSGSQTAMKQLVMKDVPLMPPAEAYYTSGGMGPLVEHIAEYENREKSIGYTYCYYLNNLYKNDNVKVLKINGISPDNENIISGAYPFSTAYYAVIADGEDDAQTAKMRELRDYLLTDEGQEIIKMAGYCPLRQEGQHGT